LGKKDLERLRSSLQSLITNLQDDKLNLDAHLELATSILEELDSL